jgi:hypothetical protein
VVEELQIKVRGIAMGFHFSPQPTDKLKEKIPLALSKIWIADGDLTDRPGLHREHVFDFDNGLRLIISKDKFPGYTSALIHVSGSYPGKHNPVTAHKVYEALNSIGLYGILEHIGDTPNKVAHWILELSH